MTNEIAAAANRKRAKEIREYLLHFIAAFDEFHEAVVSASRTPELYIGRHYDYPAMSLFSGGFPHFSEARTFSNEGPKDYVGLFRPRGLIAATLGGWRSPKRDFPKGLELLQFLRTNDIGARLKLPRRADQSISSFDVERLVADAVERYIHLYGIDSPVDDAKRLQVILPLAFGTATRRLNVTLMIPIALTHFELDHFRLTDTTYITRIPRKIQLARARISTLGSGAVQLVVGAATHAFVSTDWHLEVDSVDEVAKSLTHSSPNVIDAVDSFFGSLRLAAGIRTGYAQILWVPRGWALEYYCDLPPVYGTTLRQYPSEYDAYGWIERGSSVTKEQITSLKKIYSAVIESKSERIRLAIKRLNSCLIRSDAVDAILDGVIGLELLLGDQDNQSLSYKLRLRSGALALVHGRIGTATEVAAQVKRLYGARSKIVHGHSKKSSKEAAPTHDRRYEDERDLSAKLLRFVLEALLAHPAYLDPLRIDQELLLRGAAGVFVDGDEDSRD